LLYPFAQPENPMKINIIPTNKLAILSAAVCAVMLAFTQNASADTALTFTDTHVVGTVSPAAPASANNVADYINFMITLAAPTAPVQHDFGGAEGIQTISRSSNTFGSLPTADGATAVSSPGPGITTIDLNALGTFTYLFAKYDGQNDNSIVWNIAGLTGVLTIPALGPGGYGLSGWILFNPTGTPGVPDGGTTVMLLGAALGALGMARRYLKS
jgi:hypothetical protein